MFFSVVCVLFPQSCFLFVYAGLSLPFYNLCLCAGDSTGLGPATLESRYHILLTGEEDVSLSHDSSGK